MGKWGKPHPNKMPSNFSIRRQTHILCLDKKVFIMQTSIKILYQKSSKWTKDKYYIAINNVVVILNIDVI